MTKSFGGAIIIGKVKIHKKAKENKSKMSNTTDIKSFNISSVLRVLHQHKALTKTEIAALLGLSSVTAHNLINELKKNDIEVRI